MTVNTQSLPFGAEVLNLEHGRLARQADATVIATVGGTVALVSVVAERRPSRELDFFPLMVDYREKFYAAGKFPGGFFKRESRPGDAETLRARVIDRAIRPLFAKGFGNETQVYVVILSTDQENQADAAALNAASAALNIAKRIPFTTPLGAVRVGQIEGEFVLNPTHSQMEESSLDLMVAGTEQAISMVECGSKELSEERMVEALMFGHEAIKAVIAEQKVFIEKCSEGTLPFESPEADAELASAVEAVGAPLLPQLTDVRGKENRDDKLNEIRDAVIAGVEEKYEDRKKDILEAFDKLHKKFCRKSIIETGIRSDGRKLDEVRPITCEVGVLPRVHGSAVFTRGETQALAVVTLGTVGDQQKSDNILGVTYRRFMLHYNFPSYSVGETKRIMGPGRREIGHGRLAERAIEPTIPDSEDFPYTLRVVSEITESNGSSSMASVCGGTLALMDAGVPLKKPAAGIAMGLIEEGDKTVILSDILGLEDHLGDMDFKVTGTEVGITALQMDIKITGVSAELLKTALEQARLGRAHILGEMLKCLPAPREDLAPHAPRIEVIMIDREKIKDVIGPGGKIIRSIVEETGAKIDIEDDGSVYVAAESGESMNAAIEMIKGITADVELNTVYTGKVVRVVDFGCFVEILPNKDGLVHISELEVGRVEKVEDVCREGDSITVKVIDIDQGGRVRLSRKAVILDNDPELAAQEAEREKNRPPRRESSDRGGSRGGGRGGDRGGRPPRGGGGGRR